MSNDTEYVGMALTKRDLAIQISEESGLNQQQALQAVQMTLDGICAALEKGQHVEFRDFGVFEIVVRKARIGRNPNNPNVDVVIPQRAVVKFKSGKILKQQLKKIDLKTL